MPFYVPQPAVETWKEKPMTYERSIMHAQPLDPGPIDRAKLTECIQACFDCAQTCAGCADLCMSEETTAELTTCVHTNLDCFDICAATGKILSRNPSLTGDITRAMLQACRAASNACAEECGPQASTRHHCEVCAEACRRCEQACIDLLASLAE